MSQTAYRLEAGQDMEIEPGNPAVTARIEPGDGTPAFHFPTIEPPSDKDYADASQGLATLRVVQGSLDVRSGPATVLNDGHAQHDADSPRESLVFAKDTCGRVLMDLGHDSSGLQGEYLLLAQEPAGTARSGPSRAEIRSLRCDRSRRPADGRRPFRLRLEAGRTRKRGRHRVSGPARRFHHGS